jgi:hypothetical protein
MKKVNTTVSLASMLAEYTINNRMFKKCKKNKDYAIKKLSKALYRQVEYGDYYFVDKMDRLFEFDDMQSNITMNLGFLVSSIDEIDKEVINLTSKP